MEKKEEIKHIIDLLDKLEELDPSFSPDRILIIDFDVLEGLVTHGRMELVKTIRDKNPQSVGELAKLVKRPQESVSRDLTILHNYGILESVKTGKIRKPKIEKQIMVVQPKIGQNS